MKHDMHHAGRLYDTAETNNIRSALDAIPADIDYENWVRIGMALKVELAEPGYYLFDEWSQGSSQYKQREIRQKWRSFKRNGITIKTVFKLAIENGWQRPKDFNYTPKPIDKELLARERAEKRKLQCEAAKTAQSLWYAGAVPSAHPYLKRKGIQAHGIHQLNVALLVPMRIGKKLWSVQRIYPNGGKFFLAGGKVNGTYFSIGQLDKRLWVCEGFATGASIFESTGDAVAIAFSAGNMANVAAYFLKHHSDIELLIAADSDPTGIKAAEAAMKAGLAARMVYPDFKPGDSGKDWNDHAALYGKNMTLKGLNT